jgi:hypothetical protein
VALLLVGCAAARPALHTKARPKKAVIDAFDRTVRAATIATLHTEHFYLCLSGDPHVMSAVGERVILWYRCAEGRPVSCRRDPEREALEALNLEHLHPNDPKRPEVGTTPVSEARMVGLTRHEVAALFGTGTRCDAPRALCATERDRPTDWFYPIEDAIWARDGTDFEDGVAIVFHFDDGDRVTDLRWSFVASAATRSYKRRTQGRTP